MYIAVEHCLFFGGIGPELAGSGRAATGRATVVVIRRFGRK
jgi:hypothetical protein